MSQLNIYVPDDLEKKIRSVAKRKGLSLSAYVAEVLKNNLHYSEWKPGFFEKVLGQWKGEFPTIDRQPLEEDESAS